MGQQCGAEKSEILKADEKPSGRRKTCEVSGYEFECYHSNMGFISRTLTNAVLRNIIRSKNGIRYPNEEDEEINNLVIRQTTIFQAQVEVLEC